MVYKKQLNEEGDYIGQDGLRYDVLSCNITESKEWVQVGTDTQEIDGEIVEIPIMEHLVFINKGWDEFEDLETAVSSYGLMYDPLLEERKLTNE